ncbi:MAG: hypothetical protein WEB06_00555 [Actinomycetota bacterium]
MNVAHDLLARAHALGVVTTAEGDQLRLRARTAPPADLLDAFKVHKPDVLAALRQGEVDAVAERAAIVEEGAGVPREWAEGFAQLDTMPCPAGVASDRWRQVIDDAGQFLDRWAAQAAALGWATADVFGVDAARPEHRLDRAGLVWLLDGRPIVAIGPDRAAIRAATGSTLTYYRRDPADREAMRRVPLWKLAARDHVSDVT